MPTNARILLVDDDQTLAESIQNVLESRGYRVTHVDDGDHALDHLEEERFDVILTDLKMPVLGGMELLEQVRKSNPLLPVILMTAFGTSSLAIEATRKGAFDYLIKPFEMPDMLGIIAKAAACGRMTSKKVTVGGESPGQDAIVGSSRKMQEVFKEIGLIADKPIPVLIRGETGTGKELIARAIFQHSPRASRPFVAVNCAAIPENLIESELFGHERGAFTHAVSRRIGRFEQADGGTLFLDEIGDLPAETQVKLLRVLQERTISRLGGKDAVPVDVRVISATHRDLDTMIAEGSFREDLYYRLNASAILLPPLRERPEDIPALADYFLARYSREFEISGPGFHKDVPAFLSNQDWPGNVRELENVVRKALIDSRGFTITAELVRGAHASLGLGGAAITPATPGPSGLTEQVGKCLATASRGEGAGRGALEALIEDVERELYSQAVTLASGNQTKIAEWLGVSRLTVREKLDRYRLFPKRKARSRAPSPDPET